MATGKEPLMVNMDPSLKDEFRFFSEMNSRSMTGQAIVLIRKWVEEQKQKQEASEHE